MHYCTSLFLFYKRNKSNCVFYFMILDLFWLVVCCMLTFTMTALATQDDGFMVWFIQYSSMPCKKHTAREQYRRKHLSFLQLLYNFSTDLFSIFATLTFFLYTYLLYIYIYICMCFSFKKIFKKPLILLSLQEKLPSKIQ